tara:strand:+ start:2519 stop:2836 length:318 start_codon:yes stop_codon:yes gene_type:complete
MITKLTPYMITHAKSFERDFTKEEWFDFGKYKTKILRLYKIYKWVLDSIKGEDLETWLLVNFLKNRGYTDFIPPKDRVNLPWEYFDQSGQFYDDYVIEQSLGKFL